MLALFTQACEGPPDINSVWKLVGSVSEDGETIFIDFSPKGGPKDLLGVWDGDGARPDHSLCHTQLTHRGFAID
eukprot:scaffold329293_cov57-Tisochrysis_lutea.AAC.2